MKFSVLAELFSELEGTSKRLEKIVFLRDFLYEYSKEAPLVFDIIAGTYQKEMNKKEIGISLKTIFSVLSFVSKEPQEAIEKEFNKVGDVGKIAEHFLDKKLQQSLQQTDLTLGAITTTFESIKETTGQNSTKIKKEKISKLFLATQTNLERRFLARLLIDDLRVGVSEGVLREAYVTYFFPSLQGIPQTELEGSKEIEATNFSIEEIIKQDKKTTLIVKEPRETYNTFLDLFEKKYNVTNSFRRIDEEVQKNRNAILKAKIELGKPIKSMLGVRAANIEDAVETVGENILADYKYDGLRVQIHNKKGKCQLFSRNLDEITKQFPEVVQFVKDNFSDVSFVMDTECVGYDFEKRTFLPFQLLSRRILTKEVGEVAHIKVVVKAFDLLYINEETIIDQPYKQRREQLESLFLNKPLKQELNFDPQTLINSK